MNANTITVRFGLAAAALAIVLAEVGMIVSTISL